MAVNRRILITGCSGGGKSTIIEELARRGHKVVREAGLRVIQNAGPKPWEDRPGFINAVTEMSRSDLATTPETSEPVFFDRGLFDALSGLTARRKEPLAKLMPEPFPYAQPVFYAPPWPEIFEQTADRPHGFDMAHEEAIRLRNDLDVLGIETVELPKVSVNERVEIILQHLKLD